MPLFLRGVNEKMTSTITWMVALITFGLVILTWEIFEKTR